MEKIRYTLENLDCAGCAAKAEAAVNKAPWIEKAIVDFMNKRLTVHLSDINPMVGVNVVLYEGDDAADGRESHRHKENGEGTACDCGDCEHEHTHSHEHGGEENETVMLITTVIALIAGAVGIAAHFLSFPHHEIVSAAGYIGAILFAGYDVAWKGVKSVGKLRLDESALMAIAMVAAAILGEFFEGAMVAVLYRIGE